MHSQTQRFAAAVVTLGAALTVAACQPASPPVPATPSPPTPTLTATMSSGATAAAGAAMGPTTPAAMGPSTAAATPSSGSCELALRFAALRSQVGPATVGDCLENEHQVQGTNDSAQRTSNGVFTHRDLDNRNLFSTATQTWVDGPDGLVTRPTNERFEWEGDRQLVNALRGGGFVLYFRHGATDPGQTDSDPNNLANCATQRNLTDAGRAQARSIGEAFLTLGIPIGSVLSSEYCRALEYSRLAFNKVQPEASLDLTDPLTDQQKAESVQTIKRLLSTHPAPGGNTVLVSHSPNIRLAADVDLPVEGEAVIFRVDPAGTSTLVTRILPGDWSVLAQALPAH